MFWTFSRESRRQSLAVPTLESTIGVRRHSVPVNMEQSLPRTLYRRESLPIRRQSPAPSDSRASSGLREEDELMRFESRSSILSSSSGGMHSSCGIPFPEFLVVECFIDMWIFQSTTNPRDRWVPRIFFRNPVLRLWRAALLRDGFLRCCTAGPGNRRKPSHASKPSRPRSPMSVCATCLPPLKCPRALRSYRRTSPIRRAHTKTYHTFHTTRYHQ